MSRNKKRIGHSIAAAHSNDFAALQRQKSCVSVQHFAPFPLFGRARSTSRYRMPPVLPSVGPEATLRTPDFRLPAIRPTFIFRPLRINLSTPKIKKVANECLQPSRPPGRLRRERDSNPRYSCPYTAFRVRPDRPLRHLSLKIVPRNHRFGTANIDIFFISAHFRTEKIASGRKKSSGRGRLPAPGCFRFRNNSYLCPERTACREQYFAAGSVY